MPTTELSGATARRNRIIAIIAGAITVIAIVLGFAGDFLGLPWKWLRPVAELLLLGELVGLIVLERHQLFEPVHEKVAGIETHVLDMKTTLGLVTQQLGASGQTTVYPNSHELLAGLRRFAHDAFSRDLQAPQTYRSARLSGGNYLGTMDDHEFYEDFRKFLDTWREGHLLPGSTVDAKSRWWSLRVIYAVTSTEGFELYARDVLSNLAERKPLNCEGKLLVLRELRPGLSPALITDREAVLVFDDATSIYRWGIGFQGANTASLFARWFDDLWASIPDASLVYSRNGINQSALDRIRAELGAIEADRVARTPATSGAPH